MNARGAARAAVDDPRDQRYTMPRAGERTVPCPQCGGPSVYAARNPYRPFCCARCKGVDLGHWASEDFRVQSPEAAAQDDGEIWDAPAPGAH